MNEPPRLTDCQESPCCSPVPTGRSIMTETEAEALRRRAEEIHASYKFGYAGKPRATRRLDELDGLVQSAAALAEERIAAALEGKTVVKQFVVAGRLVNLVVK